MKELIEGENLLNKFEVENDIIILTDKRFFFNDESYPLKGILSVTSKKEELIMDGAVNFNFWAFIILFIISSISVSIQYFAFDLAMEPNFIFWLILIGNFFWIYAIGGFIVKYILLPLGVQNKKQESATFTVLLKDGNVLIKRNYRPESLEKINLIERSLISLLA